MASLEIDSSGQLTNDPHQISLVAGKNQDGPGVPLNIAFVGHDSNESTIRKRIRAFQAHGANVNGLMFRRRHDKPDLEPHWMNVPLGSTDDRRYGRRTFRLLAAFPTVWQHRSSLRSADIIYARNIDMLMIAFAAKKLTWSKAPLVYEALDVHPAFTKPGWKGRALQFAERALLNASQLLVVSSPSFIERYFSPIQKFSGPWFLLENKLHAADWDTHKIQNVPGHADGAPWVIGWFGVIRCLRSLHILQNLASRFPDRVIVHIRGLPSETDGITEELLKGIAAKLRNIFYFGTYQNPRDLEQIYGAVDLAWAVDFSASGANSDWLIPNRLYESGIFGVPAIARRATATGDIVEKDSRGWCLDEPFEENLATFISQFDSARLESTAEKLRRKDLSAFVDVNDTLNLMRSMQAIALREPSSD